MAAVAGWTGTANFLGVSAAEETSPVSKQVKPPQPKLGLSAAFGSGVDWETSQ